jgi:hypothetical protein
MSNLNALLKYLRPRGAYPAAGLVLLLVLLALTAVSRPAAPAAAAGPLRPTDLFPQLTFELPVGITHAGDSSLFVVEQPGRIWLVEGWGMAATKTLFLDIADEVQSGGEQGLLGLAFHPQYRQNGFFYVNYTATPDNRLTSIISRFQALPGRRAADPQSELLLLQVEQPFSNHNGGDLHFDPQGMLVISLGDGGLAGDPFNNAQNPQSLLGKLLRIDVNRAEGGKNYAIPTDNPFRGDDGIRDEIWTLGLRNPWRFSFDRLTGDLTIGDVGQNVWAAPSPAAMSIAARSSRNYRARTSTPTTAAARSTGWTMTDRAAGKTASWLKGGLCCLPLVKITPVNCCLPTAPTARSTALPQAPIAC